MNINPEEKNSSGELGFIYIKKIIKPQNTVNMKEKGEEGMRGGRDI